MKSIGRDRKYWLLSAILVVAFGLFHFTMPETERSQPAQPDSQALEQYRHVEEKFFHDLSKYHTLDDLRRERPAMVAFLSWLSLFFAVLIGSGIAVDVLFLSSPSWRSSLQVPQNYPTRGRWRLFSLFKVLVLFIAFGMVSNILLAGVFFLVSRDVSMNLFSLIQVTLTDLACVLFIYVVLREEGAKFGEAGFRIPSGKPFREILLGIAGYAGVFPIFMFCLFMLILIAQLYAFEPPVHPIVNIFIEEERSPATVYYSIFLATVLGPVIEEVFFRGFCYPVLKARWGTGAGMVLSSAFFAVIHENLWGFIPIFILGMALTYVYEKRGTLVTPIVLHLTHNAVFISFFLITKGLITR